MKLPIFLMLVLLALPASATEFDVTFRHWDNYPYTTTLPGGGAVLGWPGRAVVVIPRVEAGTEVRALTDARRRGRSWRLRPNEQTNRIWFRFRDVRSGRTWDTGLHILVPARVTVDARGRVVMPTDVVSFPLGIYPDSGDVPRTYRARAAELSSRFYLVTDSSRLISKHYSLGMFLSKTRPDRSTHTSTHLLALDYGLVDLLERITALWNAHGYRGVARIESPFRTPDYNDADTAGRATFSLHMYGSACDVICSVDDDHLHDDTDRDGDRDLDDLLPMARLIETAMRAGRLPKGGIGVYHYIHRDGREEELTIHVDLRGRMAKWGSVYDSDTVHPKASIDW